MRCYDATLVSAWKIPIFNAFVPFAARCYDATLFSRILLRFPIKCYCFCFKDLVAVSRCLLSRRCVQPPLLRIGSSSSVVSSWSSVSLTLDSIITAKDRSCNPSDDLGNQLIEKLRVTTIFGGRSVFPFSWLPSSVTDAGWWYNVLQPLRQFWRRCSHCSLRMDQLLGDLSFRSTILMWDLDH